MNATPAQQQALLALADTDEEIRRLEHKRVHLPEQQSLNIHEDTQVKVADELVQATATQERLAAQSARHEREIETANAGRKHSEAQIYSGRLTNERELEARREEISEFQRRKSDLEDSLLENMEQLEEVSSLVDELSARRSELTQQITDLTLRRDTAAQDIDAELTHLGQRRNQEIDAIGDSQIVAAYDRLRSKRQGRVVARLQGRTCTGCQLEQTAIELEELKQTAAHSLAYCQQCGSIIVPA
ncbi:MAG: zinc ribbon domain-containing protein [Euzebya sp.]